MPRQPASRRRTSTAAALGIAAGVAVASAPPAAAHDELLGTEPADGEVLDELPGAVRLTYSNEVAAQYLEAAVAAPGGDLAPVPAEALSAAGPDAVLDVDQLAVDPVPGVWQVVVRIVSADGHPVESTLEFEVREGSQPADPEPTTVDRPTAEAPASSAAPDPTQGPDPSVVDVERAADVGAGTGESGTPAWLVLALAAGGLAVSAGVVVAVAVTRRRSS